MTVNATEFKSKCLQLMDRVKSTHEPILITKRGEVVAQLAPPPATAEKPWLALRGTVKIKGDVIASPLNKKALTKSLARTARQIRDLPA